MSRLRRFALLLFTVLHQKLRRDILVGGSVDRDVTVLTILQLAQVIYVYVTNDLFYFNIEFFFVFVLKCFALELKFLPNLLCWAT